MLKQDIIARSLYNRNGEQEQTKPAPLIRSQHPQIAEKFQTTDMRLKVTCV